MKNAFPAHFKVIYLALAAAILLLTFSACTPKSTPLEISSGEEISKGNEPGQTPALLMYNELVNELSEEHYGGMYIKDDGSLVINAKNVTEVNKTLEQIKSNLSNQAESAKDLSSVKNCKVSVFECKYSLAELDEISSAFDDKWDELNITKVGIDEENNKITVGISSGDAAACKAAIVSHLSSSNPVDSDIDYSDCIEVTTSGKISAR